MPEVIEISSGEPTIIEVGFGSASVIEVGPSIGATGAAGANGSDGADGADGEPSRLAAITGINGAATGATNLYTATADTIITSVALISTAASGVSSAPIAGVGVAAGEDDFAAAVGLLGLTAVDKVYHFLWGGTLPVLKSGETLKLGIDTAAVGTLTLTGIVHGYEI